nr:heavy metal sensor histidine kinase [Duganella guangzhouensis]
MTAGARASSIAFRLTLLFAIVSVLTFAAVGTYLYQVLVRKIELRDDGRLVDKVVLVRSLLSDYSSIASIDRAPAPFRHSVHGIDGLVLRLSSMDGKVILQTTAPMYFPSTLSPQGLVPITRTPQAEDVHRQSWAPDELRVLNAIGVLGDVAGTPVQISISRPRSRHSEFLRHYLLNLACAVTLGATVVAVLGFLIVRQGMAPLRMVISQANNISTHRMNTRLPAQRGPLELRELGAAFNAMLDRLEDGVQRLSGFAADLAHDLRTPVNTLMMETQVALSRPRTVEEYQTLAASNLEEYEHLATMIENTLFLARVDNAGLAINRQTLDAQAELLRIRNYFEGLAEEAGITLTLAQTAANATLDADATLLRRALGNLLSNAIAHTPRGGAITLTLRQADDGLQIDVANTGDGVAAQHLPHIFERYYRADSARPSNASTGLGLAIVRAIMRLHGGEATVHSMPGATTTFSLRFCSAPTC